MVGVYPERCCMVEISATNDLVLSKRRLRRREASAYLAERHGVPISPRTLAKMACVSSDGPPFRKFGRIPLYDTRDLDTWAQSRLGPLVHSTSEPDADGHE